MAVVIWTINSHLLSFYHFPLRFYRFWMWTAAKVDTVKGENTQIREENGAAKLFFGQQWSIDIKHDKAKVEMLKCKTELSQRRFFAPLCDIWPSTRNGMTESRLPPGKWCSQGLPQQSDGQGVGTLDVPNTSPHHGVSKKFRNVC